MEIEDIKIKGLIQNGLVKIDSGKFVIDLNDIISDDLEFSELIIQKTRTFLNKLKAELKELGVEKPIIKILNWKDEINISEIRVKDIGRTVKVDGMLSKITEPMALVVEKSFECVSCGTLIKTPGFNPKKCSCGGKTFKELDPKVEDIQEIVLEELQEKVRGRQPKKTRIRLTDSLTWKNYSDILSPGTRISVMGQIEKIKVPKKTDEELYTYRIFAFDITLLDDKFDDTISEEDLNQIIEISQKNPLETLSKSLAPNIYGREELKKILLLQMLGGVKKELSDGKFTRDFIHILVVGAPGTSKSDLGKNVNLRCPKSFYSTGDSSSGVGLTASVAKDEILGNWGVEVGPMVKASGSLAIIDELDKFPKEQLKSLHTPLEMGFVKVNKAGIDAIFPAETSVLGLANPKFGIFEENKSIVEQLNLPPALLSRFDIIYTLKDDVVKEMDDRIVKQVYIKAENSPELINVSLFRKYITYAKKLTPDLPNDYLEDLQGFYHDVRKKSISRDSKMKGMPIGVRHLQGIIRLAEASAKLNLREKVEKEDIELAKELFYDSLVKIGMDEGIMDMARISGGKTASKKKYSEALLELIRSVNSNEITELELKKLAEENGIDSLKFYDTLFTLSKEGIIYKNSNIWRLV